MGAGAELVLELGDDLDAALDDLAATGERLWLRAEGLDAIALAAVAANRSRRPLGVVVPLDREPSVLARDLTTLSLLCPAGLVVALRAGPEDEHRLAEYVAVMRAMFSAEETTLELGGSHLVAAPNRPLPTPVGGPPIWVDRRNGAEAPVVADGELLDGDLDELGG